MSGLSRYEQYDDMSTEALEELLRQDYYSHNDEESDMDAILYITQLLVDRSAEDPAVRPDRLDASWNSFRKNFIVSHSIDPQEDNATGTESISPASKKKAPRRTFRIMLIAAIITVLLAGATYAAGILGWFPRWNSTHFVLTPEQETSVSEPPPPCTTLEEALAYHNAPSNIVPGYFPDGYEQIEFGYTSIPGAYTTFSCLYSNGEHFIALNYYIVFPGQNRLFTKDEENPELYTSGGIDHHIVTNAESYKAIWQNGNFECCLSGFESREELIKTIDSMY